MLTFQSTILTYYGSGTIIGKTPDGNYVVTIPKKNLTKTPPNYRGGPAVTIIHNPNKKGDNDHGPDVGL